MDIEEIRKFCLSFPGATEDVKWGNDLTFCVGKKMFAVTGLETAVQSISFKCTPEKSAELVEKDGIIPAHYVARYHWVTLEKLDALETKELRDLIKNSYKLVWEKLPKNLKNKMS
ncbi:MAG: MmcQ/YjbR family DNA-binding protein [Pyrinomonadaceae bacterium]